MTTMLETSQSSFIDRRSHRRPLPGVERRQFSDSHEGLTPDARELAIAIDEYKLHHRRRFITYEEMMHVIQELGYYK